MNCGCDEVLERSRRSCGWGCGCDEWFVLPRICGVSDVCEGCWLNGVLQRSWAALGQVMERSLEESPRRPARLDVWPSDKSSSGEEIERPFPADIWFPVCTEEDRKDGWRVMMEMKNQG